MDDDYNVEEAGTDTDHQSGLEKPWLAENDRHGHRLEAERRRTCWPGPQMGARGKPPQPQGNGASKPRDKKLRTTVEFPGIKGWHAASTVHSACGSAAHLQVITYRALRHNVLQQMHNRLLAGHVGEKKTYARVKQNDTQIYE